MNKCTSPATYKMNRILVAITNIYSSEWIIYFSYQCHSILIFRCVLCRLTLICSLKAKALQQCPVFFNFRFLSSRRRSSFIHFLVFVYLFSFNSLLFLYFFRLKAVEEWNWQLKKNRDEHEDSFRHNVFHLFPTFIKRNYKSYLRILNIKY